jgi:hypothetical protein
VRRSLLVAVALGLLVVPSACRGGGAEPPAVILDGRPRPPDDEGIMTEVAADHLVLDGRTRLKVSGKLIAFASSTGQVTNLYQRRNQYVQVGVRSGTVVWLGAVGAILPGPRPFVLYQGNVLTDEGGRLTMEDGTVLRAHPELPPVTGRLSLRLDVTTHEVVEAR